MYRKILSRQKPSQKMRKMISDKTYTLQNHDSSIFQNAPKSETYFGTK
ncbi:hypothetical protein LEP1GSC161_2654 [Leptospira santarosai str. CBC1416]|uniref:Uncharacterized protein n=1 Tax=Leptospira santarosai str. CBC1416 TaxID=1193059 RepID=M6VKE0_9LEPT|nr:hypothetical protein LEP1GSC163_4215 [Leptospira santarosai str. CBC379]EMJ50427.1 hypothetical protein LEP1GSC169_3031 [Leptospira santarosai str. HAI1349]EMM84713.1 hypothetical protein LEP1GSC039_2986 [Leptospira santarosai str. 2000027870]EMO57300.1 hypothetical protein LEP1GSC161_2654 [Leptospira santarosai str. CBC1416]EPG82375.1 hypothetical protein LEP1GSC048_1083 [Leptospira santarosai serovar Shermani str. 1342KT]